jgi:nitroreductase
MVALIRPDLLADPDQLSEEILDGLRLGQGGGRTNHDHRLRADNQCPSGVHAVVLARLAYHDLLVHRLSLSLTLDLRTLDLRTTRRLAYRRAMETWDAIRARRNVRTFERRPIPEADLKRVLEAGWRSPSASNRQKWDFVMVTDHAQLEELSTVWVGAKHLAGAAAAVVMVLPAPESERYLAIDQYDLGQATMAMMLAATDRGIGSGHSAVGDQEACRRILGVPAERHCAYMLALGYPEGRPLTPITRPDRRPFDEVVHWGHW